MIRHLATRDDRVVRVFVSSTFRDMQAERDELVKWVFPQLRKLCEERGVIWSEVDLRWGITQKQAEKGEVLPICLAEIQRCRPYFIGLLGERYGWVPDEIPEELIEQEPWLNERLHHSVTELEILHGVLNNPKMCRHALFYFRDPGFIDSVQIEERPAYIEVPTDQEIESLGELTAKKRAEERKEKLVALKALIRGSGLPVRENYANPQALGALVLRDLTEIVDRVYPKGSEPGALDRAALDHEAFAQSRVKIYIGRTSYYDRLDEHARGDGPPLVLLGDSGSGKSALLASWVTDYQAAHGADSSLAHFIGASPDSGDWTAMLRRILSELDRRFGVHLEIPSEPDALRAAFARSLHLIGGRATVVLVLDALNQLEDRDGAPDLVWLPPVIPPGVRMIVSTLPGRPLDELRRRDWPSMTVEPLEVGERKELISEYLAQYSKRLSSDQVSRIARAKCNANPLYLRAVLDELRFIGEHARLDALIKHYLTAKSVDTLYERILERYTNDYERDRPGLVRDAMSLLWAAHRGLSEAELLDVLGADGNALARAFWSPLYLVSESLFVNRSGLLGFSHAYVRRAVGKKYLSTKREQRSAHMRIAEYFGKRELGTRVVDELPWQLSRAERWKALYELLTDLPFFNAAWEADKYQVMAYWTEVETHSPLRLGMQAYADLTANVKAIHVDDLASWASLLSQKGRTRDAMPIQAFLVSHHQQQQDQEQYANALNNLAEMSRELGDLENAMEMQIEVERVFKEMGNEDGEATSLGNQALIADSRGDTDKALGLMSRAQAAWRRLGKKDDLARSLNNQAEILRESGELDAAMSAQREVEQIFREQGDIEGLTASIGNQALILIAMKRLDEARVLLKQVEEIRRRLGNAEDIARNLNNLGMLSIQMGSFDEGMKQLKQAARMARELDLEEILISNLHVQALALTQANKPEDALPLAEQAYNRAKKKEDTRMIRAIEKTLGFLKGKDGEESADLNSMTRALRDPDSRVRTKAVEALAATGDAKAAEPLIEALKDPDASVMGIAAASLAVLALRNSSVEKILIRRLRDKDEDVRWGARTALDGLEELKSSIR